MTKTTKTTVWIIVALIIIAVLVGVSRSSSTNDTGPIKIGFIGPLTGDAAAYGEPIKNGIDLAVKEINQKGGINGRQIIMDYGDGKCTGQDAASAAQKLVNVDGIKYIIGGVCSGEAFGFAPITSGAKVMVIMPGASAPKLSGVSPYIIRNNPNDNLVGIALADYLQKSYKNIATISEQTDYAQGIKTVFLAETQKDGLNVVGDENYNSGTTDFRSLLLRIKNNNPDVVFINSQTGTNLVQIAKQARQLGINVPIVSAVFGADPVVLAAGSSLEGVVFADAPGLASAGKGQTFLTNYEATYGGGVPTFAFYAGAAYDDVYLLDQAITNVGYDTTKIEQYLHSLTSYDGTIGTYSFDQNGDIVGITPIFQKIVSGKLVNIN